MFGRKYTIDTVIRLAFYGGIQDMKTLADCYPAESEFAHMLRKGIHTIQGLKGQI